MASVEEWPQWYAPVAAVLPMTVVLGGNIKLGIFILNPQVHSKTTASEPYIADVPHLKGVAG